MWTTLFSLLCLLVLSISGIKNRIIMQNIKTPSFTIYVQQFWAELNSVFFSCGFIFLLRNFFFEKLFRLRKTTKKNKIDFVLLMVCMDTCIFIDLDHSLLVLCLPTVHCDLPPCSKYKQTNEWIMTLRGIRSEMHELIECLIMILILHSKHLYMCQLEMNHPLFYFVCINHE